MPIVLEQQTGGPVPTGNVRFDDVELAGIGLSVLDVTSRQMAAWRSSPVEIPGRSRRGDSSQDYEVGVTSLAANLSADTDDWELYTHAYWLNRLDALKSVLNPRKGFRKLVMSGDLPDRYRWCRYQDMTLTERRPVFKLPFQPISINFENAEPFWREIHTPVSVSSVPAALDNNDHEDATPLVELEIGADIVAYAGARIQPVVLFTVDDLQVSWKGAGDNVLEAGDILRIDSETMTVTRQKQGIGLQEDVVRFYDYAGAGAFYSAGFPTIRRGGGQVTQLHPNVASLTFHYDVFYL